MSDLPRDSIEQEDTLQFLEERINFYSEKESNLKALFEQLQLSEDDIKDIIRQASEATGINPIDVMQQYQIDNLNSNTVAMAEAKNSEEKKDKECELKKLNILTSHYKTLNEQLERDISQATQYLNDSPIDVSTENVSQLQRKLGIYKKELEKFSKHHPFLEDSTLNLPNILEEAKGLEKLQEKKKQLLQELSVYGDLKPDIHEAAKQLEDIKKEHSEICMKIASIE